MATPNIPLPKFANYWFAVVGASFAAAKWSPWYQHVFEGIGYIAGGLLMSYLAMFLPSGSLEAANKKQSPFHKIPELGKHVRQLALALGLCIGVLGIAMLLGIA